MAGGSIKLFQFTQNYCQILGIYSNKNRYKLIAMRLIVVFCAVVFAAALIAFLLYDAKSMCEYGVTVFILTSICVGMYAYFFTSIWERENIFKFIENCEKFIKKSK